ncbi:MAG: helix-turn-helix transcriptional regulator [bacterium]|nr:helix-turn-helix transcriptional regulator [bacterium]
MGLGEQNGYERPDNEETAKTHKSIGGGRPAVKIRAVAPNNRKRAFEVKTSNRTYVLPYVKSDPEPTASDHVAQVFVDEELGHEGFTYVLKSGREGSVHIDQVLEYNKDPDYLRNILLYRLTLEARKQVDSSRLSKREIVRRLGTSAAQFYRLLDQTNYSKSIDQILALLHVLDCDVDLVVHPHPVRVE